MVTVKLVKVFARKVGVPAMPIFTLILVFVQGLPVVTHVSVIRALAVPVDRRRPVPLKRVTVLLDESMRKVVSPLAADTTLPSPAAVVTTTLTLTFPA